MSNQLSLDIPAPEDPWEKEYIFDTPKKYWEELVVGEICKYTAISFKNKLCIINKIIEEVFAEVEFLTSGETALVSLCCLVPASESDLASEEQYDFRQS